MRIMRLAVSACRADDLNTGRTAGEKRHYSVQKRRFGVRKRRFDVRRFGVQLWSQVAISVEVLAAETPTRPKGGGGRDGRVRHGYRSRPSGKLRTLDMFRMRSEPSVYIVTALLGPDVRSRGVGPRARRTTEIEISCRVRCTHYRPTTGKLCRPYKAWSGTVGS